MTEGQRRLLAIGGVAALIFFLRKSPAAQADLAALYRALTQGLGPAPAGPTDGGVGTGNTAGPLTAFLQDLARVFRGQSAQPASSGGNVFRIAPTPIGQSGQIVTPGTTPSQIVNYVSQVVQNGYKLAQQVTTPDSLLNKSLDYVKNLFSTPEVANVAGGTVGNGADVLGTGATTVTAPDILLPVSPATGTATGLGEIPGTSIPSVLSGGSEAFDPAVTGGPPALTGVDITAQGGVAPAVDIGAGAVDAAGVGAEVGGTTVGATAGATTVADSAIFASESAAATASGALAGVTAGAAVAVAAALAYWQFAEQRGAQYFTTFPLAVRGTEDNIQYAISGLGGDPLSKRLQRVTTKQQLADELGGFKQAIAAGGVGGYTNEGAWWQLGPLPGAGGSAHEGGVTADWTAQQEALQTYINALRDRLPGPEPTGPDTGSTKFQAAAATYTRLNYDPALGDRSQFTAAGSWQTYVASTTGKPLVIGTVPGTDTLKTIAVPPPVDPNVPRQPTPHELATQYAPTTEPPTALDVAQQYQGAPATAEQIATQYAIANAPSAGGNISGVI